MALMRHTTCVAVLSLVGLGLSLYAIHVEEQSRKRLAYKPYCDISLNMMCSKVLTSPYTHLLALHGIVEPHSPMDVSNHLLGIAYYTFMLTYPIGRKICTSVYFLGTIAALIVSGYLSYIMYAVLSNICVVLAAVAAVNVLLFVCLLGGSRGGDHMREQDARRGTAETTADRRMEDKKVR